MWSSSSRLVLSFVLGGSSLLWLFKSDLGCSFVKDFIGQLVMDPGPPLVLVMCLGIRPTVAILKVQQAIQPPLSCL